jgi:L-alanine-DL-glutamate epimerase-like enolase superfamily enzyme
VRDEHFMEDLPKLRQMTSVPIAAGEEWGWRWDFNKLIENHDIDFNRCTLPNVGGITEMLKIMALCETHAIGIVPHFTGPVATAALVHCLATYPGTVMFEYNFADRKIPYLPEYTDFKAGKLYPNERPGLGVTLDTKPLTQIGEVTEPVRRQIYNRPDGSLTHW